MRPYLQRERIKQQVISLDADKEPFQNFTKKLPFLMKNAKHILVIICIISMLFTLLFMYHTSGSYIHSCENSFVADLEIEQ